jgi:hypothetical protein
MLHHIDKLCGRMKRRESDGDTGADAMLTSGLRLKQSRHPCPDHHVRSRYITRQWPSVLTFDTATLQKQTPRCNCCWMQKCRCRDKHERPRRWRAFRTEGAPKTGNSV